MVGAPPAFGAFPYPPLGVGDDYSDLRVGNETPNDLGGDNNEFKYAATPNPLNFFVNLHPAELTGIRGARVVDANDAPETAWETTTGRPDVTLAVLDSGIRWDDTGPM